MDTCEHCIQVNVPEDVPAAVSRVGATTRDWRHVIVYWDPASCDGGVPVTR